MLQNIRARIQGWVAGIIIGIIALTFVFWSLESYQHMASGNHEVAAKVNGEKISTKEVEDLYQQWKTAEERRTGKLLPRNEQIQLHKLALERLINSTALFQAAQKEGFLTSTDQIKQMIVNEPIFQENGHFSEQKFQQILEVNELNPEKFFTQMQESITTRQIFDGIVGSAFVVRKEMALMYSLIKQTRDFGYFLLPSNRFFEKAQIPTNQQIESYYQVHKEEFKSPEKIKIAYLQLSPNEMGKKLVINEQQVKKYYLNHIENFSTPAEWQINVVTYKIPIKSNQKEFELGREQLASLRNQLLSGKNISEIIKVNPNLVSNQNQWINSRQIQGDFIEILQQLKINEVSQPFRSPEGVSIVQLKAIKPERAQDFNLVKAEAENLLRHEKVQDILNDKSQKLSELTYTNPNTLLVAADELNIPVQTSDWITKQGQKQGIFANQKLVSTAFSSDILQQGNNSEPIELKDGTLIVVRVALHQLAQHIPLSEVKPQIVSILQQQIAQNQAGMVAFEIQKALEQQTPIKEIEAKYQVKWQQFEKVERNDKKIPKPIITTLFTLIPTKQTAYPVTTALLENGDYAILQLQKMTLGSYVHADPNDIDKLHTTLSHYWGQMDYQLYMQNILNKAKIKYYQDGKDTKAKS